VAPTVATVLQDDLAHDAAVTGQLLLVSGFGYRVLAGAPCFVLLRNSCMVAKWCSNPGPVLPITGSPDTLVSLQLVVLSMNCFPNMRCQLLCALPLTVGQGCASGAELVTPY
jgi:hypothetical protein